MFEALLLAIPLGLALSFAAGPIFFVVIETSISIGKSKAFMLDLGAVTADIVFISIAFYGSQSLLEFLQNIWVSSISALAIISFGVYYIRKSRTSGQFQRSVRLARKRHYYFKGFLLNILNIGVLFYWIATTVAIGSLLNHDPEKMITFFISIILVYLFIDVFKIFFANRFKERLKGRRIQLVEGFIGIMMVGFGVFIVARSIYLA
jgi:threonine/homoserine/homoserine lactone efflux protein